jgi:hypothetical protein
LEKGRFTWPQSGDAQGKVILSHEELSLLLGGIDLTKTKHKRWYRKASPRDTLPLKVAWLFDRFDRLW